MTLRESLVNQKILFVDDEPDELGLYRQMLKGELDISTAASGEEGIAMLRNLGPFAIVPKVCASLKMVMAFAPLSTARGRACQLLSILNRICRFAALSSTTSTCMSRKVAGAVLRKVT